MAKKKVKLKTLLPSASYPSSTLTLNTGKGPVEIHVQHGVPFAVYLSMAKEVVNQTLALPVQTDTAFDTIFDTYFLSTYTDIADVGFEEVCLMKSSDLFERVVDCFGVQAYREMHDDLRTEMHSRLYNTRQASPSDDLFRALTELVTSVKDRMGNVDAAELLKVGKAIASKDEKAIVNNVLAFQRGERRGKSSVDPGEDQ